MSAGASPSADGLAGVLGGGVLNVDDYAAFLAERYLADYLPAGGAAVKVAVVGSAHIADRFEAALAAAAAGRDCLHVRVAADQTKIHMIDQLFFAVSRHVDWDGLAAAAVHAAYDAIAFPAPAPDVLRTTDVAAHHDVDGRELYRSVRRALEARLLGDQELAPEMRRAMLRLAQVHLGAADVDRAEHQAVLAWLRGELRALAVLRPALIYSRIGRHNARDMLASLSRLLLAAGHAGLVLHLDCFRLAEARRPPVDERSGLYYSKAATLDAYEVLRQLIDATDDLRGLLAVAAMPPELMTDESRGLPAYTALHLRVADEVRDRRRANPYAALVRLEVRLEAVA